MLLERVRVSTDGACRYDRARARGSGCSAVQKPTGPWEHYGRVVGRHGHAKRTAGDDFLKVTFHALVVVSLACARATRVVGIVVSATL